MLVYNSTIAYWRYLLKLHTAHVYGGCMFVSGSEVDLECMATWKDLPDEQYMVARLRSLTGAMSTTESRYRCFVSIDDSVNSASHRKETTTRLCCLACGRCAIPGWWLREADKWNRVSELAVLGSDTDVDIPVRRALVGCIEWDNRMRFNWRLIRRACDD